MGACALLLACSIYIIKQKEKTDESAFSVERNISHNHYLRVALPSAL